MLKQRDELIISEALEYYLEAIYVLSADKPAVRITDIAMYLGISKPSVNRAVNSLKNAGLVEHEPYGDISLTECGCVMGKNCLTKHRSITRFFVEVLNLDDAAAESEACKIEHSLSQKTVERMIDYMNG